MLDWKLQRLDPAQLSPRDQQAFARYLDPSRQLVGKVPSPGLRWWQRPLQVRLVEWLGLSIVLGELSQRVRLLPVDDLSLLTPIAIPVLWEIVRAVQVARQTGRQAA